MNLDKSYIRIFPGYEQVFQGDMAQCKKHFLPICSLNLKAIYPEEDQWLHFVSVNEIYDGCVGQQTEEFHTDYCKMDMLGFNVIGDKYSFEADWRYFIHEQETELEKGTSEEIFKDFRAQLPNLNTLEQLDIWFARLGSKLTDSLANRILSKFKFLKTSTDLGLVEATLDRMQKQAVQEDLETLAGAYKLNQDTYAVAKSYFEKHGSIYPMPFGNYSDKVSTLQELESDVEQSIDEHEYPEFFGILSDIQFHSKQEQDYIKEFNVDFDELRSFEGTNLLEKPYDSNGNIFEYIGRFTGHLFQCYGADSVYLFYNKQLKKAVICLEYT